MAYCSEDLNLKAVYIQKTDDLKLGKDLGIAPIKLESKFGNKDVDDIQKKVNEILYFFKNLYITESVKNMLMTHIVELGKELNEVNMPLAKGKMNRKVELREKMINIYTNLKKYIPNCNPVYNDNMVYKMNKYLVAQFLKEKQEKGIINYNMAIDWIKKIKIFSDYYDVCSSLRNCQEECWKVMEVECVPYAPTE